LLEDPEAVVAPRVAAVLAGQEAPVDRKHDPTVAADQPVATVGRAGADLLGPVGSPAQKETFLLGT
jgi:hypothetical protein